MPESTRITVMSDPSPALRALRLMRWRVEATFRGPRGKVARFALDQAKGRTPRPL